METRRRAEDVNWEAAKNRRPWTGPTQNWGEDVNTRLGLLETSLKEVTAQLRINNENAADLLEVFNRSKKVGLALIAVLAFLGYSGILAVWTWVKTHIVL